ncbi:MAG: ribosome biogenesis GTP-binding protein YihA/YsxC [Oscillospiraceae bacterium]|jgi:GTP-binding protein|nr:ribosome biogenesis GTP-binding protein YihA/YsxC [Oscillospiraceae bacterium]
MINWNTVTFEAAFGTEKQLPPSTLQEIAFAGRSNVGKSSLINKLFCRKNLARTGKTPGKTVTVNFFKVGALRFADLPGYGYAKLSFAEKQRFAGLMESYFTSGRQIVLALLLLDMRHPPSDGDEVMLNFLKNADIPFIAVLTKSDKLNQTEKKQQLSAFEEALSEYAPQKIVPFSTQNGEGVAQLRDAIEQFPNFS